MIVCVCNAITKGDLEEDPSLIDICGTQCGSCKHHMDKKELKEYEKKRDEAIT